MYIYISMMIRKYKDVQLCRSLAEIFVEERGASFFSLSLDLFVLD